MDIILLREISKFAMGIINQEGIALWIGAITVSILMLILIQIRILREVKKTKRMYVSLEKDFITANYGLKEVKAKKQKIDEVVITGKIDLKLIF